MCLKNQKQLTGRANFWPKLCSVIALALNFSVVIISTRGVAAATILSYLLPTSCIFMTCLDTVGG